MIKNITKKLTKKFTDTYNKQLEYILNKIPEEYKDQIKILHTQTKDPILRKTTLILNNIVIGEVEVVCDDTKTIINVKSKFNKDLINGKIS